MNGAADNKHLSHLTCVCVRKREKLPCDLFLKVYLSLSISTCILSLNIAGKSLSPSNHSSHFSFTLGVYNVTGRKNVYSVYFDTDASGNIQGHKLCIFGAPIPYVNLNFKF